MLTGEEAPERGLWLGEGDALRDLDALRNARRSRRWTSVSTKPNCLPLASYLLSGMVVMKGAPK